MKSLNDMYANIRLQIEKFGDVQDLMGYFSTDALIDMHNILIKKEIRLINKAIRQGRYNIDKINNKLEEINLSASDFDSLYYEIRFHNYFPFPVTRALIPKSNGKQRSLGIPMYRDKVVQSLFAIILNYIYESIFHTDVAFAYINNQGCHQAIDCLSQSISDSDMKFLVKVDIKDFFNQIDHKKLLEFLGIRIKDKYFLMNIRRFLEAGIVYNGIFHTTPMGVAQGTLIAPVLSNVYLNHIIDEWFKSLNYKSRLIRYADDISCCFTNKSDALNFISDLEFQLGLYHLQLEPTKTKIISLIDGIPFNFLGLNIFRKKNNNVFIKMSQKKLAEIEVHIVQIIKDELDLSKFRLLIVRINALLNSYYNYYGYYTNYFWLEELRFYTINILFEELINDSEHIRIPSDELLQGLNNTILKPDKNKLIHL